MKLSTMCAVILLVAGCSAEDPAPAATGSPEAPPAAAQVADRDACALITVEEASRILGSTATATSRSMSAQRSVCDYVTQSYESFTLEAIWSGAAEEIKIARGAAKKATGLAGGRQDAVVDDVMGLHTVEGLGDEAYFARRTMSYVRKGDVLLTFHTAGLNDPAREHWEALARAALARL